MNVCHVFSLLSEKTWQKLFVEKDKLQFLKELVPHYAHHLAFQNITLTCVPPEERHVPSKAEVIYYGLNGIGGNCITQNGFLTILLQSLGLNAYIAAGYVYGPVYFPDNHVTCVVEFSPKEKWFLDLGVGLPFAEPVPLHQLPYTRVAAGFRYQYLKNTDGTDSYIRVQLDGGLYGGEYEDKSTVYPRYVFTLKPQPLEFFHKPLEDIFTKVDSSIFLQYPFLFRYIEEDESGKLVNQANVHGDRKWILIRGVSVLIGKDSTRNVTHYETYDEVKNVILKYFPQFDKEDVEKAIQCFNESVPKHGYFKSK